MTLSCYKFNLYKLSLAKIVRELLYSLENELLEMVPWFSSLSHCLQCWLPISELLASDPTWFLSQLPAKVLGRPPKFLWEPWMESKEACELFCPECILFFHGQISNGCCYINLGLKQMRLNSLLVWDIIAVCLEQTFIANQQNKHLQTLYSKATDFSISITWEEKSSLSCKYWQWLGCLDYGRWLINLTV